MLELELIHLKCFPNYDLLGNKCLIHMPIWLCVYLTQTTIIT